MKYERSMNNEHGLERILINGPPENCDCVPNYRYVSYPNSGVLINFITSMTRVLTSITQNAMRDFKILIINISIL